VDRDGRVAEHPRLLFEKLNGDRARLAVDVDRTEADELSNTAELGAADPEVELERTLSGCTATTVIADAASSIWMLYATS
jgi:hypothetical protein